MIKHKFFLLIFGLVIFTLGSCKQQQKVDQTEVVTNKIDSLMQDFAMREEFNGNVLVTQKGKTLYKNSFGYADSKKTEAMTANHRFNIGSIYKEFPAVAVMQLAENGKLNVEDKISNYLPELPQWAEQVSIKNLLQYSSGLPRVNFGKYFSQNQALESDAIWEDIKQLQTLEFTPGEGYLYSNNNPFLLTKIIESVTGQTSQDYIQENLLDKAGMKHTLFKEKLPYVDKNLMAIPFNKDFQEDPFKIHVPSFLLSATAQDMNNWLKALHSEQLINADSLSLLAQTAAVTTENKQAPLGSCKIEENEIIEHSHHGSSGNYECLAQYFKENDLSIILLTNQKQENLFEIADKMYVVVGSL